MLRMAGCLHICDHHTASRKKEGHSGARKPHRGQHATAPHPAQGGGQRGHAPAFEGRGLTASFIVAIAVFGFLLISGCSNETSREDGPAASDQASSTPGQEATTSHGPLTTTVEGSSGSEVAAPPSDGPVPDVVGMKAEPACRALLRGGYAGGVVGEVEAAGVRPGRVVEQGPKPGYEGGAGQLVRLVVSAPFRDALPQGSPCVERRPAANDTPPPE